MNRKKAVKTLSDFINNNTFDFDKERDLLHNCLSYLENIAIRKNLPK